MGGGGGLGAQAKGSWQASRAFTIVVCQLQSCRGPLPPVEVVAEKKDSSTSCVSFLSGATGLEVGIRPRNRKPPPSSSSSSRPSHPDFRHPPVAPSGCQLPNPEAISISSGKIQRVVIGLQFEDLE